MTFPQTYHQLLSSQRQKSRGLNGKGLPETFTEADGHLIPAEVFTSGWGNLLALP